MLLLAGNRDGHDDPNRLPQVWRQDGGGLRDLSSAVRTVENYSKTFVAPDGRVFLAGPNRTSSFLDPAGTGAWAEGPRHVDAARPDGTAVMYDDGKVLVAGGGQRQAPTNTAEVIDLQASTRLASTGAMATAAPRQRDAAADGRCW